MITLREFIEKWKITTKNCCSCWSENFSFL